MARKLRGRRKDINWKRLQHPGKKLRACRICFLFLFPFSSASDTHGVWQEGGVAKVLAENIDLMKSSDS